MKWNNIIIFGFIVSFIIFLLVFLCTTIYPEETTLADRLYISLGVSSCGFIAAVILGVRDKYRHGYRKYRHIKDDFMFEMLVSKFKKEFPHTCFELENDKWQAIKIPNQCKDVGEIRIYYGLDDIIVGIGDFFHAHFEVDYKQEPEEAESTAISEALKYVRDFMMDRVVLRLKYRSNRPVSASTFYALGEGYSVSVTPLSFRNIISFLLFRKAETKDFVWSGSYEPVH